MKITAIYLTALDKKLVKKAVEEYQNDNLSIGDGIWSSRKKLTLTDVRENVLYFRLLDSSGNTKVTVGL